MPDRASQSGCHMTSGRREILIGAASAVVSSATVRAQSTNPFAVLGLDDDVVGMMQTKPADILRVLTAILKLETAADQRQLPPSTLSFKTIGEAGSPMPTTRGGLYAVAVPRLIRVMDRAEGEDPGITDEAGKLLAELNAAQREIPEALRRNPPPPSRATSFDALKSEYSSFFSSAQLRSDRSELADWHKRVMLEYRPRYEGVAKTTLVPWYFIGAIHGLEASYDFRAHLHNGISRCRRGRGKCQRTGRPTGEHLTLGRRVPRMH